MTLKTRPPTGMPAWPMLLVAGVPKSGKSYSAVAFSASDLIDRTFVIEVGEGAADAYGAMPGARFEIVEHDGSFKDIGTQIKAASAEPTSGKPNALVVDSMTEIWDLLCAEQQVVANNRRGKNGEDATITMDQWNVAKKRWRALIDVLRTHNGPVILTARFEETVVMGADDKPTKDRVWKVRAEKNLPFEVDAIIEMRQPREYLLTGVRSLVLQLPAGGLSMPVLTIDTLLRKLGFPTETAERNYTAPRPEALVEERQETQDAEQKALAAALRAEKKGQGVRSLEDLPKNENGSVNLAACSKAEKDWHGLGKKDPDHEALVGMPTGEGPVLRSDAPSVVDELWQEPVPADV